MTKKSKTADVVKDTAKALAPGVHASVHHSGIAVRCSTLRKSLQEIANVSHADNNKKIMDVANSAIAVLDKFEIECLAVVELIPS